MGGRIDRACYMLIGPMARWIAARWDPVHAAGWFLTAWAAMALALSVRLGPWWFAFQAFFTVCYWFWHKRLVREVRFTPPDCLPFAPWWIRTIRCWSTILVAGSVLVWVIDGQPPALMPVARFAMVMRGYLLYEPRRPHPGRLRDRARAFLDRLFPVPSLTGAGA